MMIDKSKGEEVVTCESHKQAVSDFHTKVCPCCGQVLFADMNRCYGCLYQFKDEQSLDRTLVAKSPILSDILIPDEPDQVLAPSASCLSETHGKVSNELISPDMSRSSRNELGVVISEGSHDLSGERDDSEKTSLLNESTELLCPNTNSPIPTAKPVHIELRILTGVVDVSVPVPAGGLTLGRSLKCDVVFHAGIISRQHARVMADPAGVIVSDLGATNPVSYHGRPISTATLIPFGDPFNICGMCLIAQKSHE